LPARGGPPPLRPFGLVLHRDGRWSHEGVPIAHPRLRAAFARSVRYLPEERKYVVQLGRFRGQIEPEEAAFLVTAYDATAGRLQLSDGTSEPLDPETIEASPFDGAWLCRVKPHLEEGGLLARFTQAAWAELLHASEERAGRVLLRVGDAHLPVPRLEAAAAGSG